MAEGIGRGGHLVVSRVGERLALVGGGHPGQLARRVRKVGGGVVEGIGQHRLARTVAVTVRRFLRAEDTDLDGEITGLSSPYISPDDTTAYDISATDIL